MKKIFIALVVIALAQASSVFAQGTPTATTGGGQAATVLATVNITDASYRQEVNAFTVTFTATNRVGVQPDVKYAVSLMKKTATGLVPVDTRVYDAQLNLGENAAEALSVRYDAPAVLDGSYELMLSLKSSSGFPFATKMLGTVSLVRTAAAGVVIDPATCVLTVSGGATKYQPFQGVDVSASESLLSTCTAQNVGKTDITVTPLFVTHERSLFGSIVEATGGATDPVTFKAGEKKVVTTKLPLAKTPQAYDVTLAYGTEGTTVPFHYVLQGGSGTIQNIVLDADHYIAGNTAELAFVWSGAADDFSTARGEGTALAQPSFTATLTNGAGAACAAPITTPLTGTTLLHTLRIPITATCDDPKVTISLADATHGELAKETYAIQTDKAAPVVTPAAPTAPTQDPTRNTLLLVSILALVLGLATLGFINYRKKEQGPVETTPPIDTTPLVMLLLLLGAFSFGAPQAHADTFQLAGTMPADGNAEMYLITANLDKSQYLQGDPIKIDGSVQMASCGNFGAGEDVTLTYNMDGGSEADLFSGFVAKGGVLSPFMKETVAPGSNGPHIISIIARIGINRTWMDLYYSVTSLPRTYGNCTWSAYTDPTRNNYKEIRVCEPIPDGYNACNAPVRDCGTNGGYNTGLRACPSGATAGDNSSSYPNGYTCYLAGTKTISPAGVDSVQDGTCYAYQLVSSCIGVPPPPPVDPVVPQCSNGGDDDGDEKTDMEDPGCTDPTDNDESSVPPPPPVDPTKPQCSNDADDEGDGKTDYPDDPGCSSDTDTTESPDPIANFMQNAQFKAEAGACDSESINLSVTNMDAGWEWYVDIKEGVTTVLYTPGTLSSVGTTHRGLVPGSRHQYMLTITDNNGNERDMGPVSATAPLACEPVPPVLDPTKPQCSNNVDDSDSEDTLADASDPGCHTDGNAASNATYDPLDADETDGTGVPPTDPVGPGGPGGPGGTTPQCSNGVDDEGDGLKDAADPDCHIDGNAGNTGSYDPTDPSEGTGGTTATQCTDGIDNDGDGLTDANDPSCATSGGTSEGGPSLTASPRLAVSGTRVTLSWDTKGDVENTCSLSGGGFSGLLALDGDARKGSVTSNPIVGRTVFTLTCPGGNSSVAVEVKPDTTEQ